MAKALEESFAKLPGVIFQDLDDRVADTAVEIAITGGLRGADAVYAATARRFDATLITLDGEQRARLPADIIALTHLRPSRQCSFGCCWRRSLGR